MSRWRRLALEQMPSLHRVISQAPNPMAMWIELHSELVHAYERQPRDEAVIVQIYGYARWCIFGSGNEDLATAVACAFYEHLPLEEATRSDMPKRLSRAEFESLRGVLVYHLGEAGLKRLAQEFRQSQGLPGKG